MISSTDLTYRFHKQHIKLDTPDVGFDYPVLRLSVYRQKSKMTTDKSRHLVYSFTVVCLINGTYTFTHNICLLIKSYVKPHSNKQIETRGQSNLTKSATRGAHSPVRGHPRGSKVVPLNSWGRVYY